MAVFKIIKNRGPQDSRKAKKSKNQQTTLKAMWRQNKPRGRFYNNLWKAVTFFSLAAIASVFTYALFERPNSNTPSPINVRFEIKALTKGGHPVAGAKVTYNAQALGVTDSYGEWRSFLKFPRGQNVLLQVVKSHLKAEKNLLVPLASPNSNAVVLKAHLVLGEEASQKHVTTLERYPRENRHATESTSMSIQKRREKLVDDSEENDPYYSIWFSVFDYGRDNQEKNRILSNNLVPALKLDSKKQGLEVRENSSWQVGIGHVASVADRGFSGVIRVVARKVGSEGKIDFLTNYTGSSKTTATKVLATLKKHTPKGYSVFKNSSGWYIEDLKMPFWRLNTGVSLRSRSGDGLLVGRSKYGANGLFHLETNGKNPCNEISKSHCMSFLGHLPKDPPQKQWKRVKMKVYGVASHSVAIFVGGYKAIYLGENTWRFWARSGSSSFLSVIQNEQITHRSLLKNLSPHAMPIVSVPQASVSHR